MAGVHIRREGYNMSVCHTGRFGRIVDLVLKPTIRLFKSLVRPLTGPLELLKGPPTLTILSCVQESPLVPG